MSNWIRGSASGHIDFSNQLVAAATGSSMGSISISSGGSGYAEGDILSISGGTGTITAQIEVVAVDGSGVITDARIYNAGVYTVAPSSPNSPTGGSGSSASFTVSFGSNGWTAMRDTTYSGSEREVILQGSGGGSDEITVGWRTFSSVGGDYYNLELHGMTGYLSGVDFDEQPGISNGFFDAVLAVDYSGCYLVTKNTSFNYYLNINAYRIIVTVAVGSVYNHAYLGWGNRFATASEYPYPMLIAGSASTFAVNATELVKHSTLTDPWTIGTGDTGPIKVYGTDGAWYSVQNRRTTSPQDDYIVVPTQRPQGVSGSPSSPEDRFMADGICKFSDVIYMLSSGSGGAVNANVIPAGTDDYHILLPCFIVFSLPSPQILMEIDEVYWCHAFGGVANMDRFIDDNGVAYRVFQNCNRTDSYAYLAVKEAD